MEELRDVLAALEPDEVASGELPARHSAAAPRARHGRVVGLTSDSLRTSMLVMLGVSLVFWGCGPVMKTGQVEWLRDDGFSRADRREILEAATQAGFTDIRKVSKRWHRPLDDHHALVESAKTVTGRRVTWTALIVCSEIDQDHCDRDRGERPWIRVGDWITSVGSIDQEERFRVFDGSWYCDVDLGDGVTDPVADLIVTAIHRRVLVNRTPQPDLIARVDTPNLEGFWRYFAIRRESGSSNVYKFHLVGDGTGVDLTLRVVGDQVELMDHSYWDA